MSHCPESDTWKDLLDGRLAEPAAAACAVHLQSCATCRQRLDELSDDPDLRCWAAVRPQGDLSTTAPGMQQLVAGLCALSFDAEATTSTASLFFLEPPRHEGDLGLLGPYRVLDEVGRGGMGIVLRGLDEALNRPVAIKVLRPELLSERMRARLVQEAQAAARFQHDHVVRVYAVAATPGGLPYLVMEYLTGQTLAQRLRKGPALSPREAAALAIQVADGLSAAHAAGLVHRDIKPGNLHRDESGRVRILDFGLARLLEVPSGLTQEGMLAGTPSYMSPEQVQGQAGLDERTDIYSLGVALYEMLIGEVPFRGKQHLVFQQILRDEPRPPRQLNDAIPRDLETICLKAMAKEPGRRYQTALALADDLRRWQRGEPVLARPLGRLGRLYRWCRRNQRVALLLAGLWLVLIGGLAGVSWQWYRAEANLDTARSEFARAEENFRSALDAVNYYETRVSEEKLLNQPGLQPLRKDLLEAARSFYARFVAQHHDDPAVRAEYARALHRLANLTREIGSLPQAIQLMEEAADWQRQLAEAAPDDLDAQLQLLRVDNDLGGLYYLANQFPASEAVYLRSLALAGRLANDHPGNPGGLLGVLKVNTRLSYLYYDTLQTGKAEHACRSGVEAAQKLMHAWPGESSYRREGAIDPLLQLTLVYQFRMEGRLADAEAAGHKCLVLAEGLVHDYPAVLEYQLTLAACCRVVGWLDVVASRRSSPDVAAARLTSAGATVKRAVDLVRPLARANPAVLEYQRKLWDYLIHLGCTELEAGRLAEAEADFREALLVAGPLTEGHADNGRLAHTRPGAAISLGVTLHIRGQWTVALDQLDGAVLDLESLVNKYKVPYHQGLLSQALAARAGTLFELGRYAEAEADLERAIATNLFKTRNLLEAFRLVVKARRAGSRPALMPPTLYGPAVTEVEEYIKAGALSGDMLYASAQIYALAAAAAAQDDRLPPQERAERAEKYAARAVDLLVRARQAAFFRLESRRLALRLEPEWVPLQARSDFRQLLAELESP